MLLMASALAGGAAAWPPQGDSEKPVVVQPGAPGTLSRTLPTSTNGMSPTLSSANIEFMQARS